MNKIVNNEEEEMGTLEAVYDTARKTLLCIDKNKNRWDFEIIDSKIEATLYVKTILYRIINVKKEK